MIITLEIHNETGGKYYITQKDDMIFIENEKEEGAVVSEIQLYQIIDEFFQKEL